MSELEERALEAEINSQQDFLSTHQAVLCHAPQSLKEDLHSSYQILLGQLSSSLWSIPSARVPQAQGQPPATAPSRPEPKWSPQSKKWHSLPDAQADMSIDGSSPMALQEGPSSSKWGKTADWSSSLKPSCADTFSQDSSPVREAREHYFATHPWDWAHGNMDNLSDIFRELAQGAGLLGESIHEIQLAWNGQKDLKHANYVLQSLPKGVKVPKGGICQGIPQNHGPKGESMILMPSDIFASYTYCPWCSKDGQNEGTAINHLRTVHYKWGLVCDQCFSCPTVMSDTLHQHGHHTCTN